MAENTVQSSKDHSLILNPFAKSKQHLENIKKKHEENQKINSDMSLVFLDNTRRVCISKVWSDPEEGGE